MFLVEQVGSEACGFSGGADLVGQDCTLGILDQFESLTMMVTGLLDPMAFKASSWIVTAEPV